ncbi:MAG: hypothetical protein ACM3S5_01865 [Rhodospirillales bacterium]
MLLTLPVRPSVERQAQAGNVWMAGALGFGEFPFAPCHFMPPLLYRVEILMIPFCF